MSIESGLYAHLTSDPDVSALVGDRIYPLLVPQDATLPAIAYQRISTGRDETHTGPSGLSQARIQLTCIADSYDAAKAVADAVRSSLDGFSGTMGGINVGACFVTNDRDDWAASLDMPVVRLDVIIWHHEV